MGLPGKLHSIAVISNEAGGNRAHHIFAQTIDDFSYEVIDALVHGRLGCNWWFALGFVAALDALSLDSIDFAQPLLTVEQACADTEAVSNARAMVADALQTWYGRHGS